MTAKARKSFSEKLSVKVITASAILFLIVATMYAGAIMLEVKGKVQAETALKVEEAVGKANLIIARSDSLANLSEVRAIFDGLNLGPGTKVYYCEDSLSCEEIIKVNNLDSIKKIVVTNRLLNGFPVVVSVDIFYALYDSRNMLKAMFFFVFILLILVYFVDKRIIEKESRPIVEFTYSALAMGKGNFNATIPEVHSEDEIRKLHDSLSYMQQSISRYVKELRSTTSANERMESELNIASAIQMAMLSRNFPHTDEVDFYASLHPAKEVGGDLYDFALMGRKLYFSIGDVSGKGVPAALFMAITRSALRFVGGLGLGADGIVSKINNTFADGNAQNMFVTLFLGVIDLDTLEMTYCNAGHNPLVLVDPDGHAHFLHAKANLAAGLFPDFPYVEEKCQLSKGTRIILYTDGVTEAETRKKELYGEDRLIEYASSIPADASSEAAVVGLAESVSAFTAGNDQNDDITILSVKLS